MTQPTSGHGAGPHGKTPGAPFTGDPRDVYVAPEDVNAATHYLMYSVFALPAPLSADADNAALADGAAAALADAGVTVRGWYDIGGFRADADLLVWTLSEDPAALQAGYHALRRSELGVLLEPVWSNVGVHRPAEFNNSHTPACFSGIAPRPWLTVYPFVRSYEWYYLESSKRSHMLRTHGMAAKDFPDVLGSTTSAFALGDYEWLLAFEADELHRLTDAMRAQRAVEARLHVREETPFFTGPRVELAEWIGRQPRR
ncbi:hydrogen peroxide-dependent heme synthase [Propioniciclava soli]|uniref:Coproheme decarboxylase n=1 Tax=Propioniciclava soli TaxID=2775081 RepID=A0ABZ3C5T9_9ACTN|nr:hydrogen peroxide-dependent heme synthase [Propioniciclava soli]